MESLSSSFMLSICEVLKKDNPRFNKDRFLRAAGYPDYIK